MNATTPYKTCVTTGAKTPSAAKAAISRALSKSEYVEARLDFLKDYNDIFGLLDALPQDDLSRRTVCTVRAARDGGQFKGTESQRLKILQKVAAYSPYMLDVELDALQKNRAFARDIASSDARILASWHSFGSMPSVRAMGQRLQNMLRHTTYLKIACMAKSTAESMRMLEMYGWLAGCTEDATLISFAMGDAGQMTRILCMHLGSPYTYVSLGRALAPGQISLRDVKKLDCIMNI